jgi:hypothetical protein
MEEPEKPRGTQFLYGLLAYAIATGLTTPLDVVKTRLMTQSGAGQYKGWLDCLRTVTKDEGPALLFRGAGLRVFDIVLRMIGFMVALLSVYFTIAISLAFLHGGKWSVVMIQKETKRAAARE